MTIDLHTHSTVSDGTDTPADLVRAAAAAGVATLGLTDHDSAAGWAEAAAEAAQLHLDLLPGAELSCVFAHQGERRQLHLLAYGFDPADEQLREAMAGLRDDRLPRAREMVRRLAADGYPITLQQVLDKAAQAASLGRPHLADVLVDNGAFPDRAAAFADVLHDDSPYYVGHVALDPSEALRLVHAAGGVAVVAHPRGRKGVPDELLAQLADEGLDGVEVDHPEHDAATRAQLRERAEQLGLIATGGSDYHGTGKTTALAADGTTAASLAELRARVRAPFGKVGPLPEEAGR